MIINIKGKRFKLSTDIVEKWSEIKTEVFIQQARVKAKKVKAIEALKTNRQYIDQYIDKTDEELDRELQDLKKENISYDRFKMNGVHFPFRVTI